MPGFNAAEAVEELDFDFTTLRGYPYDTAKGVVPEPTDIQINTYRKAISSMFAEMVPSNVDEDNTSTLDMIKKVVEFLGADREEMQDKILHTLADVCSDKPSFDELKALPFRHQQAFAGWISGVFLLPSLPMPGTTPSLAGRATGQ